MTYLSSLSIKKMKERMSETSQFSNIVQKNNLYNNYYNAITNI